MAREMSDCPRTHGFIWSVVLSVVLVFPAHGSAGRFTFTKIADTSGPFNRFDFPGAPSVNNAGMVSFLAELDNGVGGIFVGNGAAITTIADSNGPFLGIGGFGQFPAINARGTVAFLSTLDTGATGIFTGNGTSITPIAEDTGPLNSFRHPSINARGTVSFPAGVDGGGVGIFANRAGSITTIVDTSGPFNGFTNRLSINDPGTVAFLATLDEGGGGIFVTRAGSITTIADTAGPLNALGVPSINNAGTVAFFGCLDDVEPSCPTNVDAAQGIFIGSGGPLTTVADSNGPFRVFGNPSINNAGTVAFLALTDTDGSGIFTGPHAVTDKVIATGDPLFGSTVTDLGFLQGLGLNDSGEIAFFARLADGTEGIYLATPISGP